MKTKTVILKNTSKDSLNKKIKWCRDNSILLNSYINYGDKIKFIFKSKTNAILFKLAWSNDD